MDTKKLYEESGKRIKKYRKLRNLTQDQLASKINLSRTSLANLESGRQQILLHHLYEIAEALNLKSPKELMIAPKFFSTKKAPSSLPLPNEGLTKEQQLQVLLTLDE